MATKPPTRKGLKYGRPKVEDEQPMVQPMALSPFSHPSFSRSAGRRMVVLQDGHVIVAQGQVILLPAEGCVDQWKAMVLHMKYRGFRFSHLPTTPQSDSTVGLLPFLGGGKFSIWESSQTWVSICKWSMTCVIWIPF